MPDSRLPETFTLEVAGLTRELPVVKVAENLAIASFVMLGDTGLIEACARALVDLPEFPADRIDVLVCPEAKAIPLTHAMARIIGINYVVARKAAKAYMGDTVSVAVKSITTAEEQSLVLDSREAAALDGKRVAVVDDVVSTGGSLDALEKLLGKTGCRVTCRCAVLLEEGGHSGEGLVFLERLPVFPL